MPRGCEYRERRISERGARTSAASTRGRWLERLRVSRRNDRRDGDGRQARGWRDLRLPQLGWRPSRCRCEVSTVPRVRAQWSRDPTVIRDTEAYYVLNFSFCFCARILTDSAAFSSLPTRKVSQLYSYFVPLSLRNTTRNLESAVVRYRCLLCPPRFCLESLRSLWKGESCSTVRVYRRSLSSVGFIR